MKKAVKKLSGIPLIAELARVSIGTVDRALHGRSGISPETLGRVLKIAEEIGYQPNTAARSLSTGKHVRIGVCVPKQIAYFYDELWAGIRDEACRYSGRGAEFVFMTIPELGRGECAAFKKLLNAELDGIIVTPGNPENMTSLIDTAEHNGTRVVCVSTDAPMSRRSSIVCVEPRLNGLMAGELMARFVPPDAKVAIITGMLATVDHREKADGFSASFLERSQEGAIIRVIEGHEHPEESFRKCKQLLTEEPHLAGIYVNTVNCLPVCRALAATGRTRQVRVIATDLFRQMIPFIESGAIALSIHQQPYTQGQRSVRSLAEHLLHKIPLAPAQYLNPTIILRSNLHLFREADGMGHRYARGEAASRTSLQL